MHVNNIENLISFQLLYHDLSLRRQQHGTNSITNSYLIAISVRKLIHIQNLFVIFQISFILSFISINDLGQKGCKHNGASSSKRCGKKPLNDVLNNNLSLGTLLF